MPSPEKSRATRRNALGPVCAPFARLISNESYIAIGYVCWLFWHLQPSYLFRAGFGGHLEAHFLHRLGFPKGQRVLGFRNPHLNDGETISTSLIFYIYEKPRTILRDPSQTSPLEPISQFYQPISGLNYTLTRHSTFSRDIWPRRTLGPKFWTQ
jgi:hypothetical protein